MRSNLFSSFASVVLLSCTAVPAADSLRAFGFEFTVISNAVLAIDDPYDALKVLQVGGPECGDYVSGSNDVENAVFGVSVHLGEAQSGVYIYPDDAGCLVDGEPMWGNAYGSVNGETNRLIS